MKKIPIKINKAVVSKEVLQELGKLYVWYRKTTSGVYFPPGFFSHTGICAQNYGIVANGKWYGKDNFWDWLADGMPVSTQNDSDFFAQQEKLVDVKE